MFLGRRSLKPLHASLQRRAPLRTHRSGSSRSFPKYELDCGFVRKVRGKIIMSIKCWHQRLARQFSSQLTRPFHLTPFCSPTQHPLSKHHTAIVVDRVCPPKLLPYGCRLACRRANLLSAEHICIRRWTTTMDKRTKRERVRIKIHYITVHVCDER